MVEGNFVPNTIQRSVKILSTMAIVINLKAFFPVESKDFPFFIHIKSYEKTVESSACSCPLDEACRGRGGGVYVACLNFKTSRVGVYKCLSLIVGFAVTVVIWLREVVSCRDFILHAVATLWAMSLVGIYPGRAS